METGLILGTYNLDSNGISFSYTVPSMLTKEMSEKISFDNDFCKEDYLKEEEQKTSFDNLLTGVLSVPKPKEK